MNVILTCRIIMVTSFHCYAIATILLTSRMIPNQIILAFIIRPNWHRNTGYTLRGQDIWNNNVKTACKRIVIFNGNLPAQRSFGYFWRWFSLRGETASIVYTMVKNVLTWQQFGLRGKLPSPCPTIIAESLRIVSGEFSCWVLSYPEIFQTKLGCLDRPFPS